MAKFKRFLSLMLALAILCPMLSGLGISASGAEATGTYTYDMYIQEHPENWGPMSVSTANDEFIRELIRTPLVDVSIKNSATGEFQWVYLAATSITNVTDSVDNESGSVFEIALNPDLCWEDGTPINADTYIYSMQVILDPEMDYHCASTYYEGAVPLAGAKAYALAGRVSYESNDQTSLIQSEEDLVLGTDGNYYTPDGDPLFIGLNDPIPGWLGGNTLKDYVDAYGDEYFDASAYAQLEALADDEYRVVLNPETLKLLQDVISNNPSWGETPEMFFYYIFIQHSYPQADWDKVGLKKVDEYTLRYHCNAYISDYAFLSFCRENWLVHKQTYEACRRDGTYCAEADTTVSYGPYKLKSADSNKYVLVRNEKHFEYNADLSSVTSFPVDGKNVSQWQADTIVAHVLTESEAQQQFLAGKLDIWNVSSTAAVPYLRSTALYQAPASTTFSLIINTNTEVLQNMDVNYNTSNAVVLSNYNFRKAFSLALDRNGLDFTGTVHTGQLGLLSEAYYYDVENNPASNYRKSEVAMQAICDLYDVAYGPGTPYATLEAAYASIDGYDLEQAKDLMAKACDELVAAGLYTRGDPIVLTYAASTDSDRYRSIAANISAVFNKAAQGSGFGTISVELRNCGMNWSNEMRQGRVTMVLSGYSGSVFEPYGILNMYLDPDLSFVPKNMDAETEQLTLNISGEDQTMSWATWGGMLVTGGRYHGNVEVLAKLESAYLKKMYAIPAWSSATNTMRSYQVSPYTREYSSLCEFGGIRLLRFNYTDAQWDAYVSSGKLNYEGEGTEPEEPEKPAAPTVKVSNVASTGKIKLTWEKVDGAAKYEVYRATSKTGTYTRLSTTTGTSLTNTSTTAGKTYYYKVRAVDANGNKSEFSSIVSRTCDLPRPEITLSNVASTGKIKIAWEAIEGATKYEVYRSTDNKTWTLLKSTTGTSLTNTSTTAGTTYYYKVKAIASSSAANSAYSTVKSRTCDLAQPTISSLTITASTGKIKIKWGAVEGATKYELYCSTDNQTWKRLTTTTGTSINHNSAVAGTKYYYKVRAISSNSAANSAYSAVKYGTCDLARPTLTVKLNTSGKPYLTWTKIEGAVKYEIYRSTDNKTWTKLSTTTGTKLTNTSAKAGTTYYYKVRAIASNTAANSAYSTVKSIAAK